MTDTTFFDLTSARRLIAGWVGDYDYNALGDYADGLAVRVAETAEAAAQLAAAEATLARLRDDEATTAIAGDDLAAADRAQHRPSTTRAVRELQETLAAQAADYEWLEQAVIRIAGFAEGLHTYDAEPESTDDDVDDQGHLATDLSCSASCVGCALINLIPAHLVGAVASDTHIPAGEQQ